METVRWGIIGCGEVTERKSGPAFNQISSSSLQAVMGRSADKARDYSKRHNVPVWYSDAQKLIEDQSVDAVYIATPPETHAYYAMKVADAGKPAYVEKPMARTVAECEQMYRVFKEKGTPLFVAYYRRRLPTFLKLKNLIDEGIIGDILSVHVKLFKAPKEEDYKTNNLPWRLIQSKAGGGYFYDLASHQLDILDYILGPIVRAEGMASNRGGLYSVEDTVHASFQFQSGVHGTGEWCFVVNEHDSADKIQITGTKGTIELATFDVRPIKVTVDGKTEEYAFERPDPIQRPLIQTVVDELIGKDTCPSTGYSAMRTNKVMEEIVYGHSLLLNQSGSL